MTRTTSSHHISTRARIVAAFAVVVPLAVGVDDPAGAQAGAQADPRGPGPAVSTPSDRDGNRIFDDLEAELGRQEDDDRVRVIVQVDGDSRGRSDEHRQSVGDFDVAHTYRNVPAYAAEMTPEQVRRLARRPGVQMIEEDQRVRATLDTAKVETGVDATVAEFGVDGDRDGNPTSYSKNDVVIAVIDTGIDAGHPGLDEGKVLVGKNFLTPPLSGDCTASSPAGDDDSGHGTHVASIAAGTGEESPFPNVEGVAPGAALVSLKALDCEGIGSLSDVVAAIDWAIANQATYGIDVINMSLGSNGGTTGGQSSVSKAANRAVANGIVTTVAAGNTLPADDDEVSASNTVEIPGDAEHVITVGAVTDPLNDPGDTSFRGFALAGFSGRGPTDDDRTKPDVVAPGVGIYAADFLSDRYVAISGTSMAAPFVAGVAALLLDAGEAPPSGSVCSICTHGVTSISTPVKDRIMGTATDFGAVGVDNEYGAGIVDAYAAIDAVSAHAGVGPPTRPDHRLIPGSFTLFDPPALFPHEISCTRWPIAVTLIPASDDADFDLELQPPGGPAVSDDSALRQKQLSHDPSTTGTFDIGVERSAGAGDYLVDVSSGEAACEPGVTVRTDQGVVAVEEGGTTDTYTVALDTTPASNVTVDLSVPGGGVTVSPDPLTFTPVDAATPQTVTVTAIDDTAVEGPHTAVVDHTVTSGDAAYGGVPARRVVVHVVDNDSPPPPATTTTTTTKPTTTTTKPKPKPTTTTTTTAPKPKPPAPVGSGYSLIDDNGGLFNFGTARFFGSVPGLRLTNPGLAVGDVVGGFPTHGGAGYVIFDDDGRVFTFGKARNLGSVFDRVQRGVVGRSEITGGFAVQDGAGYVLIDLAGGVHTFGKAKFLGSVPGLRQRHAIGEARVIDGFATHNGAGYVLVDDQGGLFNFGKARFLGSVPGLRQKHPSIGEANVVGGFATHGGDGYVVIDDQGGLFNFGKARFLGSVPQLRLTHNIGQSTIIGGFATHGGDGYVVIDDQGGLFDFGKARFLGSVPGLRLANPSIGRATVVDGFAV